MMVDDDDDDDESIVVEWGMGLLWQMGMMIVGRRSQIGGFVFQIKCALAFASTPTRVLHDFSHYYYYTHIYDI